MPTTTPPQPGDDPLLSACTMAALRLAWEDVQRAAHATADLSTPDGAQRLLETAQRLCVLDKRLKYLTIIALRVHGHTWDDIGARLGRTAADAEMLYGGAVEKWLAGDPEPWTPHIPGVRVAFTYPIAT